MYSFREVKIIVPGSGIYSEALIAGINAGPKYQELCKRVQDQYYQQVPVHPNRKELTGCNYFFLDSDLFEEAMAQQTVPEQFAGMCHSIFYIGETERPICENGKDRINDHFQQTLKQFGNLKQVKKHI